MSALVAAPRYERTSSDGRLTYRLWRDGDGWRVDATRDGAESGEAGCGRYHDFHYARRLVDQTICTYQRRAGVASRRLPQLTRVDHAACLSELASLRDQLRWEAIDRANGKPERAAYWRRQIERTVTNVERLLRGEYRERTA